MENMPSHLASSSQDADKYIVRFHDEGLRKQIKVRAALNERTLNAEIIYLIKKGMAAEKDQLGATAS